MVTRILLLLLTAPPIKVFQVEVPGWDLILIAGELFLLGKSTFGINERLEGEEGHVSRQVTPSLASVITQIMLLEIIFFLDSVITAVGMVHEITVAVGIMMFACGPINSFVNQRSTLKILALSFLLLIGFSLVADELGLHIPKGTIYFAMGFSVFVEVINLQDRGKTYPVQLRTPYSLEELNHASV